MNPVLANLLLHSENQADQVTIRWYQPAISYFIWPVVNTQPDISYSVGVFSRYYANPRPIYCNLII